MEKPAQTDHPIHELLKRRWSPRAFDAKPVEAGILRSLLEAARWAASSFNEQPWRFVVATTDNKEEYDRLLGCLMEKNQQWARQAPVLMISFAKLTFTRNNKPNRVAVHDVGAAAAQLTLEAMNQGLFVHQMAGIDQEKIRKTYNVPDGFEPVAAIAVGYPGNPASLPEDFREGEMEPRERKPLKEFVFSARWDNSSPLVT